MDETSVMRGQDDKARRKKPGHCPVCLAKLVKNARGSRYERRCLGCRASFQKLLKCLDCGTSRVWQGPEGIACKGCGRTAPDGEGWVERRDLVTAQDTWRRIKAEFPELEAAIEYDRDSAHMCLGELEIFANQAIARGDFATLERTYAFVLDLASEADNLHPDVLKAIHAAFLEGLNFGHTRNGEKAKELLPAVLKGMWERHMAHNRSLGWT